MQGYREASINVESTNPQENFSSQDQHLSLRMICICGHLVGKKQEIRVLRSQGC